MTPVSATPAAPDLPGVPSYLQPKTYAPKPTPFVPFVGQPNTSIDPNTGTFTTPPPTPPGYLSIEALLAFIASHGPVIVASLVTVFFLYVGVRSFTET